MKSIRVSALVVVLVALVAAGCSSDNKVGEDVDLSIGKQVDQQRLGQATTTLAPPPTVAGAQPGGPAAIGRATTTTKAPETTTTTQRKEQFFEIGIFGDNSGSSQFNPSAVAVARGVNIRWTNRDTVARSVEAENGAFNSGMIPPGGTFIWKADKAGAFNYTDGTRPYAVGRLEVR